jgi:acetyl-CoA carboxylase beta subunit
METTFKNLDPANDPNNRKYKEKLVQSQQDLQDVEAYKFTETLLKRKRFKVANCEKEHDSTSKQVKSLTSELDVLDFEAS